MEKRFFVYCITNLINNKKYIGKTSGEGIESRWKSHLYAAYHPNCKMHCFLHKAILKHGEENFIIETLEEFDNETLAYQYETWWIDYFGTFHSLKKGYNLTYGGIGSNSGYKHTEKMKKHMSKTRRGKNNSFWNKKHTEITKLKISEVNAGENNGRSKLSDNDVFSIRESFKNGTSASEISQKFKICKQYVYALVNYNRRKKYETISSI